MLLVTNSFYPYLLLICSSLTIILLRFASKLFAKKDGKTPPIIEFLGKVLPFAMMPILIIYCIKDTDWLTISSVIPTLSGIIVTAALHLWKKNTILSLIAGLFVYMLLLRIL